MATIAEATLPAVQVVSPPQAGGAIARVDPNNLFRMNANIAPKKA